MNWISQIATNVGMATRVGAKTTWEKIAGVATGVAKIAGDAYAALSRFKSPDVPGVRAGGAQGYPGGVKTPADYAAVEEKGDKSILFLCIALGGIFLTGFLFVLRRK